MTRRRRVVRLRCVVCGRSDAVHRMVRTSAGPFHRLHLLDPVEIMEPRLRAFVAALED